MSKLIRSVGLALLIVGGAIAYITRSTFSTEGADTTLPGIGLAAAVIGLGLLLGWANIKGLIRGIGKSF